MDIVHNSIHNIGKYYNNYFIRFGCAFFVGCGKNLFPKKRQLSDYAGM